MTTETPKMWDVINKMNDELAEVQEENERLKKTLEEERKEHHKNFIDLHIFNHKGSTIFSDCSFDDAIFQIHNTGIFTKKDKTRAMELWYIYSAFNNIYPIKDYTMTRDEFDEYLINRGEENYEDKGYFFDDENVVDVEKCLDDRIYFEDCPWEEDLYYFERLPY
jgi:hypothetical protein